MNFFQDEFATIASLDLDPIKVKIMHRESGEGWALEKANVVEFEYRRYLYLMKKFPNEQAAPSVDVDTFWHYHILDTMKYAEDCQIVFGYFLHHFPYLGLRGEDDLLAHQQVGERMRVLYEDTFGERYPFNVANEDEESLSGTAGTPSIEAADAAYLLKAGSAYSLKAGSAYSLKAGSAYSLKAGSAYSSKGGATAARLPDLFSARPRLPMQAVN